MKLKQLIATLLAVAITAPAIFAQNAKSAEEDVTVFESVLATASWAGFKYQDELLKAKKGDYNATSKLLDFSGTVDGKAALDHSVTLLELIVSGGDQPFAVAVKKSKPKLISVLLDRLQLAQGRTKKEELRKPLAEWAPKTWAALNNKPFELDACNDCLESKNAEMIKAQKAKGAPGAHDAAPADESVIQSSKEQKTKQ